MGTTLGYLKTLAGNFDCRGFFPDYTPNDTVIGNSGDYLMVYGFYFGRLAIRTMGVVAPQYFEFTIEIPGLDVFATTALTGVSLGLLHGNPGMTNAYIKQYGRVTAKGTIEHLSPPAHDVFFNSVYVPKCIYVNFRLAATQAESGMQGTVWIMSQSSGNSPEQMRHNIAYDFFDDQGQQIGSQEYSVLPVDSQIDVAERIQSIRHDLAQSRNIAVDSISIKQRGEETDRVIQWVGP